MKVCWNITNRCNRNCKFCFRDKASNELSLDYNLQVLNNLEKLNVTKISYSGGEALLYEGIEKLFRASKEKGIYNKLNTNGSLLEKDNIEIFLKYIDDITISIDTVVDQENYFLGRGAFHYSHVCEILPIIKEKYPDMRIEINTLLISTTLNGLETLYNELENKFSNLIYRWKIIRFCPFREMSQSVIEQFQVSDDEFNNVKQKFLNKKSSFNISFVNVDDMASKNIVSPLGILETGKSSQRKYLDLTKSIVINKYNNDNFSINTNLNLYRVFFEVAQAGSLSMASKKMLVSQPAISKSIKKLEEELNVTLFYRTINGMHLTEKGEELYGYVEEAYNTIKTAERSMLESKNFYKGKLVIGVPSHIASFYLFDKLKKFHLDYPQIEISIISRPTSDLIRQLENHELDFVIDASPIEGNEKMLSIKKLTEIRHYFVALKEKDYNKKVTSLKDLENMPLILPVNHSYHRKKLNDLSFNYDVNFSNVISFETSEMIKESVLQDLGIGYLLEDIVKREIDNDVLEKVEILEDLPSITINLVYIEKYLTNVPKMFIENYLLEK